MNWADWDLSISALTAWREARGEGIDGIRAVLHVLKNRVAYSKTSVAEVASRPYQFSSMTAKGDPELILWPKHPDPEFEVCMAWAGHVFSIAGPDPDNTGGATFYFNPAVVKPSWAEHFTKTCSIGHHDFYRP